MISESCFIKSLNRQPTDRLPVWFMRQAGRYLPEYINIRTKVRSFLAMCKSPELAAEVTLQPLQRFDLDAAIIFADILLIPTAMGLDLEFTTEGPKFNNPIKGRSSIEELKIIEPTEDLKYVLDAISIVKHEIKNRCPLIGFAGSPFTVACYMVEGGSSSTFINTRIMLYQQPDMLRQLLEKITTATIAYLSAQINAGADVIMLFDTWGGILSQTSFDNFSLPYIKKIVSILKNIYPNIPSIVFVKDGGRSAIELATTDCNCIGLDWTANLNILRRTLNNKVAIQGNLDPALLFAKEDELKRSVRDIVTENITTPGYIFNLGHGIPKETRPDRVSMIIDEIRSIT